MVKHFCSKAYWRVSKCQPAKILGIIVVFTILHIFLGRTFHHKRPLTLKQYHSEDVHLHEDSSTVNYGENIFSGNSETLVKLNEDFSTEDYEVAQEENNDLVQQNWPAINPPSTVPSNGRESSKVVSSLEPLYSAPLTTKICKVPPTLPEELQKRRNQAKSACMRLRKDLPIRWRRKDRGPSSGMLSKLRWDQTHHLVYCHLPKVASTTWAWHLLRAVGMKDEEIVAHRNVHILLQEKLPPPTPENLDSGFMNYALSFLVSRHPFQRLVSAYKNKIIEAEKRRQHYVDLRKTILEKYHKPFNTSVIIPSFRDFCEYVADSTESWLADLDHVTPPDLHWMPMTYVCSPCNLRYDVFSKLETMEKDTNFIAAQCGLNDIIKTNTILNPSSLKEEEDGEWRGKPFRDPVINSNKNVSVLQNSSVQIENTEDLSRMVILDKTHFKSEEKSSYLVKTVVGGVNNTGDLEGKSYAEYINELSKEELERLYHIYRFDFDIFGYSVDDYR